MVVFIKERKRKVSSWGASVRGLSRPLLASELHDHCRSCCDSVCLAGIIGIALRFAACVLFFRCCLSQFLSPTVGLRVDEFSELGEVARRKKNQSWASLNVLMGLMGDPLRGVCSAVLPL